jgi:hypothetical protein
MVRRPDTGSALDIEIARLRDLDLAELKQRWVALYACPVPRYFRRGHLIRAVAHRMQVEAYGDLKPSTRRLLRNIVDAVRAGNEEAIAPVVRIKPGTKLIRVWQDRTYKVMALDSGFEWDGTRYRSLSEVARAITGTNWNGLVFFGVKPRPKGNKHALRQREGGHG